MLVQREATDWERMSPIGIATTLDCGRHTPYLFLPSILMPLLIWSKHLFSLPLKSSGNLLFNIIVLLESHNLLCFPPYWQISSTQMSCLDGQSVGRENGYENASPTPTSKQSAREVPLHTSHSHDQQCCFWNVADHEERVCAGTCSLHLYGAVAWRQGRGSYSWGGHSLILELPFPFPLWECPHRRIPTYS